MYEIKVLDEKKPVLGVIWIPPITTEEVQQAIDEFEAMRSTMNITSFNLLVDSRLVSKFSSDVQQAIVENMRRLPKIGLEKTAVVLGDMTILPIQSKRIAESASSNEQQFISMESARMFLGLA